MHTHSHRARSHYLTEIFLAGFSQKSSGTQKKWRRGAGLLPRGEDQHAHRRIWQVRAAVLCGDAGGAGGLPASPRLQVLEHSRRAPLLLRRRHHAAGAPLPPAPVIGMPLELFHLAAEHQSQKIRISLSVSVTVMITVPLPSAPLLLLLL